VSDGHDPQLAIPSTPHHEEEGGEGWLVSYADMMTLLVGFFVILMSFSQVDEEKFEKVKQAAAQQFGGTYEVPYGDLADRVSDELKKLGLGGQFAIKNTPQGVEISFLGTVFFGLGSADVKEEANGLLKKVIPIISAESKDFEITVEGHTDDVPLVAKNDSAAIQNNWELSSLRACRVLKFFENAGFKKESLTAVGYGDARPIVPNRDANGAGIEGNQSQNRRVVIRMLKRVGNAISGEVEKHGA